MTQHWFIARCVLLTFLTVCVLMGGEPPESAGSDSSSKNNYGAVADGIADDTAAIQAAVDSGIGELVLSKGTYRITKPIVIDLQKVGYTSIRGGGVAKLVMAGPGPAIKFIGTHFKSADPQHFAPEVWERQRMPIIDGLAIHGDHAEADGVQAAGTMQLTLTRLHLRHLRHGVHLVENNRNLAIADCHIYENRGIGVYYDDVNLHQSNITGSHISYNRGGGVVSKKGNVRNIHITGCDIESNMAPDSPATANVLIDCTDSAYGTGEVAITGCTIQHNNPSPDSANIRILGRSLPSRNQSLVREGNVTITGNVLSDVQVNVHLRDCRGVILTGNTFWQGYSYNLLIEESTNIVVGSNNFDRNPRYDYGNTAEANNGLVFRECEDCNLSGLHITGVWRKSAGLLLDNCRRMNVTNCTILDCDNAGLRLENVTLSRISDCLIRNDDPSKAFEPISVQGGRRNVILDNVVDREVHVDQRNAVLQGNVVALSD